MREYDVSHLRRSLGVVLQENFLFSGTIRENITAAKPHATFDEVVRAARLAGAEEFIDRLPRGYETHIYEGSPNLSGGQRQRLAIARALILDPKILILDEATSALDPDSEAIVNENIRRIASGRTVIVISHRLSSLVNSDAILVLERGKVAAIGRHEELLESCDIYSGLWHQQNRHLSPGKRRSRSVAGRRPWLARRSRRSPAVPIGDRWRSVTRTSRSASAPRSLSLARRCLAGAVILTLARVDRVISSTGGKIVSVDAPLVLQALDPSIVKSIDVREGEVVEKGPAARDAGPDIRRGRRQPVATADRQPERPDRPGGGRARPQGSVSLRRSADPSQQRYETLQKQLFDQRAAQYSAQLESFDQKIALTQATIDKYQNDENRYKERLGIASEVEDMRSTLAQHGNESRLNLLGSMDTKVEALRTMEFGHNSLIEAQHQLDGYKADRAAFIQQWFSQISQDLITARNNRDGAVSQLEKATKHRDLVRLTAPERAMVLALAKACRSDRCSRRATR